MEGHEADGKLSPAGNDQMIKVKKEGPESPGLESRFNKAREKLFDALYDLRKSTLTEEQADVIRAGIEKSLRRLRRDFDH